MMKMKTRVFLIFGMVTVRGSCKFRRLDDFPAQVTLRFFIGSTMKFT